MQSFGITSVPGIRVGHYTDIPAATGCTVVLCETGAIGGVDVRGSAPGTMGTDALNPTGIVSEVHAVLLSGGSAFGLGATAGVVRYLEENGIGMEFGGARIPIVPAAILFDLGVTTHKVRPGPEEGYMACRIASAGPVAEGSLGAGTGATVGKLLGLERAVKGGIGTASLDLGDDVVVGALVAVNAVGGVYNPETGDVVAGPRDESGKGMLDSLELITTPGFTRPSRKLLSNTTIGVVATNARLDKMQASKLASVAHDGLALAVRPAHLMSDGDTMFALATGERRQPVDLDRVLAASVICVSRAIVRAVLSAEAVGGISAIKELS
jgi:L-aminopeptidase/D-esterase-like protein